MLIYSKKITQFIQDITNTTKEILTKEIRVQVEKDYFLDTRRHAYYPISIVVYNDKSALGYFDPEFCELGFHERLMHVNTKNLHNIIRHELAHYMTFIEHNDLKQPHGPEFVSFCKRMDWGEDVYRATTCLSTEPKGSETEESDIFRKVQKLMALATSSNKNEAEQAMIKSQQLLLKYNIQDKYLGIDDDEKMFLKRIFKQAKKNAKMTALSKILQTFFVNVVYNRQGDFTYLEILGTKVNVQIAEYVARILDHQLDDLWTQTKKQHQLEGLIAKNSFFLGIAKGYCDKIGALKRDYTGDITQALTVLEKKLSDAKAMAYKRLSSSRSSRGHCPESSLLGEAAGRQLRIHSGLEQSAKRSNELIGH